MSEIDLAVIAAQQAAGVTAAEAAYAVTITGTDTVPPPATTPLVVVKREKLIDRLAGVREVFTRGPYKNSHSAHSYATQARSQISMYEATVGVWDVKVDAATFVVSFTPVDAPPKGE